MDGPPDEDPDDAASLGPGEDPPAGSLEALPPEAVALALAWIGPRSVKRFGATCRAFRALADWYITRTEYGLLLAQSARLRLKNDLARLHASCCKSSAADFDARAARHASLVAAALAGSGEAPPRTKIELLRFLYPMALSAHHDWVLAPYALEWCALAERRALTGELRAPPRREILALLHADALTRLEALAREDGWALGVTFAATAAAACGTLAPESRPAIRHTLQFLACEVRLAVIRAGAYDRLIWCTAAGAAITRRLAGGTNLSGSWKHVGGGTFGLQRRDLAAHEPPQTERALPLAAQWRELAGLEGDGRSPRAWLAMFECGPFELHGDAFLRYVDRLVRGEAPVVPVPNSALGDLLGRAIAGAAEDAEGDTDEDAELREAERGTPPAAE